MLEGRQQALQKKLQKENIDLAFINSTIHIRYYTNFVTDPHERFFVYVYDRLKDRKLLFLPELDYEAAKEQAQVDQIIPVSDTECGYEKLYETVGASISSIAIEKDRLTVEQYEKLKSFYPKAQYYRIETFIQEERLVKTAAEINYVKKAIELTEDGLDYILDFVRIGMTEIEIKNELEKYVLSKGAEQMAFDTLVLTGKNSANPHGVSSLRKVQTGDFLLFDFGVTINGYHSDITRTFIVGEAKQEQVLVYETVKEANERAIEAVKESKPIKEIDHAARKAIDDANYGNYFIHRTGHGLGLEVHEQPSIHAENEKLLQKGMLFTIEPGIYLPSLGGVRIEDDIYIDETGKVEVLTSFPKRLMSIKG